MTDIHAQRPPLDPARLQELPGLVVEVVEQAPSTNGLVEQRAREGAGEGLVVVAEHQTRGRGRLDRSWETPPRAALTFSVLLRPTAPPAGWPWIPLLAGVAVADAVRGYGLDTELKWPNDVLVDGRKVAGILVELVETEQGMAAVVGIGINVSTAPEELPVPTATSLLLAGADVDRTELLRTVLAGLRQEYDVWQAPGGADAVRARYTALCRTAHRESVEVALPSGEVVTGDGCGIAESGALLVATSDGVLTVSAGDVLHVRHADQ
ncbi:MAG TPA: biotin--[acetyl-CoA-carboxylase] ligase [Nocardioides sp.]|uniref:biotin--[acetyl-CoA-carboxylase] ligase n=1 Tax=Nocardioides sp. TaxID=35761 RepID=UPI002BEA5711|nr:biotin--[acetyl-CoA-carboxylase] ligase [Nocardioides sp.]HQR27213.1 biotin--[acetyl-CoA-carboxylase] ligase [Nocardioides sp.]